ncbi:hypothetical protein GCM10027040_26350 [Halomonas shantousis]
MTTSVAPPSPHLANENNINVASDVFRSVRDKILESDTPGVLTMDCFDTLFWRFLSKPTDIFFYIKNEHNISAQDRIIAEQKARRKKNITTGTTEVNLKEIYEEALPGISEDIITELEKSEINAEVQFGFIFQEALELLKIAKKKGWKTAIVSDTYFSSFQLATILNSTESNTTDYIDAIYCSSEYGASKTTGLWSHVLKIEKLTPNNILHIGDNKHADYISPAKKGINAWHFEQSIASVQNINRMRANPANILFSEIGKTEGVLSPFHAWMSSNVPIIHKREERIAYSFLGPVTFSFASFIVEELRPKKNKKVAFLMRDAHLISEAVRVMSPEDTSHYSNLRISRYTSLASSFVDKESIKQYLVRFLRNDNLEEVLNQLLLSKEKTRKILKNIKQTAFPSNALAKFVLSNKTSKEIIGNSLNFRTRLYKHILKETGIKPGDTLFLVDLGYEGTTQNFLSKIMERELEIKVKGLYFLVSKTPNWHEDRKGLIDPEKLDSSAISTLTRHIAAFEILNSSNDSTVIDYSESGDPIYGKKPSLEPASLKSIKELQNTTIKFVKSYQLQYGEKINKSNLPMWKSAAIDLARYIFFPTQEEVKLLESLAFEINLGTDQQVSLVNTNAGRATVREKGTFFLTKDNTSNMRMNYPAELRNISLDLSISLMSSYRNSLDFSSQDTTYSLIDVEVLFASGKQGLTQTLQASLTYDGLYSLTLPHGNLDIAVLFGRIFNSVEIYQINFIEKEFFLTGLEPDHTQKATESIDYFISGDKLNNNLLSFKQDGFIYIPANKGVEEIIRIVFRPPLQ